MRSTTDAWSDLICRPKTAACSAAVLRRRSAASLRSRIPHRRRRRHRALGAESGQPQWRGARRFWVDGIISDISERKHNEMRIEALLAEQSAILDNVMFGVMFVRDRASSRPTAAAKSCSATPGRLVGASDSRSCSRQRASTRRPARASIRRWRKRRGLQRRAPVPPPRRQPVLVPGQRRALDPDRANAAASGCTPTSPSASQAEEKLRLSATVLEHIADGVMVIDVHGTIVAVNPAFTQITGYTESEALGKDST
jgi:PAS domain-containing protein